MSIESMPWPSAISGMCPLCSKPIRRRASTVIRLRPSWGTAGEAHERCWLAWDRAGRPHQLAQDAPGQPPGGPKIKPALAGGNKHGWAHTKRCAKLKAEAETAGLLQCVWCGRDVFIHGELPLGHGLEGQCDHLDFDDPDSDLVLACRDCNRSRSNRHDVPPRLKLKRRERDW